MLSLEAQNALRAAGFALPTQAAARIRHRPRCTGQIPSKGALFVPHGECHCNQVEPPLAAWTHEMPNFRL